MMYLWAFDGWLGDYSRDATNSFQPGQTQAIAVAANDPPGVGDDYV